jgi:lipopolysaccharide export system protein LptC
MKLSSARLVPIAFVASLALLSFWLERAARMEDTNPALLRHDPDYRIENLVVSEFDRTGNPSSTLQAARMVHFPDDDSTELEQPRLVERKPDRPTMTLRADRGAMNQAGDEIFLYDNVAVLRESGPTGPESRIETSFLHVVKPRSLVLSDRDVTISQGGRMLSGRGMEYNSETRELRLLSDVRARFEPTDKSSH